MVVVVVVLLYELVVVQMWYEHLTATEPMYKEFDTPRHHSQLLDQ